jgi:hypothetical protein
MYTANGQVHILDIAAMLMTSCSVSVPGSGMMFILEKIYRYKQHQASTQCVLNCWIPNMPVSKFEICVYQLVLGLLHQTDKYKYIHRREQMRAHEIMETASVGASSAGSVATVSMPMGTISRNGGNLLSGKYTKDLTPNTPKEYKRKKRAR